MNTRFFFLSLFIIAFTFGCKKDKLDSQQNRNWGDAPSPPLIQTPIKAPEVTAGCSLLIFKTDKESNNKIRLYGSATDNYNTITSHYWAKISGPQSCYIQNQENFMTDVNLLSTGVYEFELTATNSKGLTGRDTIKVIVLIDKLVGSQKTNTYEVYFNNLQWICPWDWSIQVKNFINVIPQNADYKVFIQRYNNGTWIPVSAFDPNSNDPDIKYDYFVETRLPDGAGMYTHGSMYISYFDFDVTDSPSVKIVY